MIDQNVFKQAWVLLCDRFNRTPSEPLMIAYYKCLTAKMNTEQFRAAAQKVFEEREFFPRPCDFSDTVKPDIGAAALGEWEQVQDVMRGLAKPEVLSEQAYNVVKLLGGVTKLRNTPVDDVQWVRKDFLAMYGDTLKPDSDVIPFPASKRTGQLGRAVAQLPAGTDA